MQRTLSRTLVMLLLLSLGGTFPAVSEQERVTITWFQSLDSKAAASMQSMEEALLGILNLMRDVQPEYNLTGVRQPMSDDGVAYTENDPLVRKFVGQGAAVSANTEHLEEVMALLDFCYSEEGNVLLNWGHPGRKL